MSQRDEAQLHSWNAIDKWIDEKQENLWEIKNITSAGKSVGGLDGKAEEISQELEQKARERWKIEEKSQVESY